jgi:elongation factor Ts
MAANLDQIKELRALTGAGVGSVREALEASGGDTDKAIQYLREKGLAKSVKRAGKNAENGMFGVYIHPDNRAAVVVEVACETDFAAKSPDMVKFANEIAVHIVASTTEYVSVETIPAEVLEKAKAEFAAEVEAKPAEMAEKILEGKLQKFYKENVLTYQQLFQDETKTVQDHLNELVAKIGEKIEITRFIKMKINGDTTASNIL